MKSNLRMRTSFGALAALSMLTMSDAGLADAAATAETTAGAPDPDPAAPDPDPAAAEARKRAAASNFLPIVRGRLPLLFVHAIRFDKVLNAMSNKDLASAFATSVGKVFDIKKGRNFGYVNAEFKPSAEDIAAAEGWIAQIGAQNAKGLSAQGNKQLLQNTLDEYKARGLASAEEVAALSAARTASRPAAKTAGAKAGTTLPSTGVGAEGTQTAAASSADDLLS